jgi:hypothetical protein
MKTIVEVLGFADFAEDPSLMLELIADEVAGCRNAGDFLGAGEWLAGGLRFIEEDLIEETFCKIVGLWASPLELKVLPSTSADLVSRLDEFVSEELCAALICATAHILHSGRVLPKCAKDLSYRLQEPLTSMFAVKPHRLEELTKSAAAKLAAVRDELLSSIERFSKTNCGNAKIASIDIVKNCHQGKRIALAEEKPIISEIEVLLGPSFRKFCESCEKHETEKVVRRIPELRAQVRLSLSSSASRRNSTLWNLGVAQIGKHITSLIDEASILTELASTPCLGLSTKLFKLDMSKVGAEVRFTCRLINSGDGRATKIDLQTAKSGLAAVVELAEPKLPFEVGSHSEQAVTFTLHVNKVVSALQIPVKWESTSVTGFRVVNEEVIRLEQQNVQPDWEALMENPPYPINAIKNPRNLFGRDAVLRQLVLHASASTSTFLWGQKRVGKTSLLQVLAKILSEKENYSCVSFRMGELAALHEGQIAHTIALRLLENGNVSDMVAPGEEEFGAGMSRLIPFMEKLVRTHPDLKFVVIIDEFDDLDSAFYTGERGRLFVKALRSLSEIGLTFFFVGSERMDTIYSRHAVDLNKWINIHLDCIESIEDCKSLIVQPLKDIVEYQSECVETVIHYCGRNPFYMHLFCFELFKRCWLEKRTFIGESDLESVRGTIMRSLGETNFSHCWTDNPVLDEKENAREGAENCMVLACISHLGGKFEGVGEIISAQEGLGLEASERLPGRDINLVVERLRRRNILSLDDRGEKVQIGLPIFKEWLTSNAEVRVLPKWRTFCRGKDVQVVTEGDTRVQIVTEGAFPIPEDDLLALSQSLVYCGKQKDVSELRVWLRQFDDDIRIEMAFLLLKRLTEKGYVSEGAKLQALSKIEEAVSTKRKEIGKGVWRIVRDHYDNLCVTYVDSEMKSGATTAREIAKRIRPGKQGAPNTLSDWMRGHTEKDALILMVDDFSGSGTTIYNGLKRFFDQKDIRNVVGTYLDQGRILCYFLYAFPEALSMLRANFPKVDFLATNVFGDDVRALDAEAKIFRNEDEIRFMKDVLLQYGRELTPQHPLGFKDMAALVAFHNTVPNNTVPVFWSSGTVNDRPWKPLFPRA